MYIYIFESYNGFSLGSREKTKNIRWTNIFITRRCHISLAYDVPMERRKKKERIGKERKKAQKEEESIERRRSNEYS